MSELKCDFCGKVGPDVINYHQRTQYVEEERNWVNACPECKGKNDEHWDEMWAELHRELYSSLGD